ncbi:MAG: hypothetical protein AAB250_00735 [Bdellovibrionota bacterium]
MKIRYLLALAICLPMSVAQAATSITTTDTNPASVNATLAKGCLKAYEQFEAELPTYLAKASYVDRIDKISISDWKETSKAADHVVEERAAYFSVSTTVAREFPMTIFPVSISRKRCIPVVKAPGEAACTASVTVTMDGKKAVSYQKAIELSPGNKSIWGSFSMTTTFTEATADSCTYAMSLTGSDNKYLWTKRHLLNGVDASLVEARIFKGFVAWGTSILPEMEN